MTTNGTSDLAVSNPILPAHIADMGTILNVDAGSVLERDREGFEGLATSSGTGDVSRADRGNPTEAIDVGLDGDHSRTSVVELEGLHLEFFAGSASDHALTDGGEPAGVSAVALVDDGGSVHSGQSHVGLGRIDRGLGRRNGSGDGSRRGIVVTIVVVVVVMAVMTIVFVTSIVGVLVVGVLVVGIFVVGIGRLAGVGRLARVGRLAGISRLAGGGLVGIG